MTLDTRQTNHRIHDRWWTCDRCGNQYPADRMVTQKGLILCTGRGTFRCGEDHYGHEFYYAGLTVPYEKIPDNPPTVPWDDL